MTNNELWTKIKNYEGATFHTVTGLPFTYRFVAEDKIQPIREGSPKWVVSRSVIEDAWPLINGSKTVFNKTVIAPSYVKAILTDPRIRE